MHTMRVSLMGTLVLALLGGLGGAVLSEDDVDAMTLAYFTLTRGPAPESIGGLAPDDLDGGGWPAGDLDD